MGTNTNILLGVSDPSCSDVLKSPAFRGAQRHAGGDVMAVAVIPAKVNIFLSILCYLRSSFKTIFEFLPLVINRASHSSSRLVLKHFSTKLTLQFRIQQLELLNLTTGYFTTLIFLSLFLVDAKLCR